MILDVTWRRNVKRCHEILACRQEVEDGGPEWTLAEYQKLFRNYNVEESYDILDIEGRIPDDIEGTFYRNGPGAHLWLSSGSWHLLHRCHKLLIMSCMFLATAAELFYHSVCKTNYCCNSTCSTWSSPYSILCLCSLIITIHIYITVAN